MLAASFPGFPRRPGNEALTFHNILLKHIRIFFFLYKFLCRCIRVKANSNLIWVKANSNLIWVKANSNLMLVVCVAGQVFPGFSVNQKDMGRSLELRPGSPHTCNLCSE